MDPDRWERVKEVFSIALERAPAARASYLDQACAGDPALRAEIDSLLEAHEQTGDFIDRPAIHNALGMEVDPPRSWIGRRVGAYRIVAEIGRGGMSEVYAAVRADDEYHKEVAVKVLLPGHDTGLLLERFKAEKQILASLDHPNIARILDAGSTDDGLPYLVMDYIKGQPIDEYCRERHLSIRQRLELFRSLCSAVQYVHQHLMVHGDLKCNNVLVTNDGSLRLLDFGVAQLTSAAASDPGPSAPIALTPEYASPEQIRGGVVSTASDVYSLGVMLYRLLTGRLPYGTPGEIPNDLVAYFRDHEPPPPSQVVGDAPATRRLRRQLRGDLDSIVMLALHKDPSYRYASVERLSEDLNLHLRGFPVAARPPSVSHKLVKFCGRHRTGIAAMGLFVLTLIGGIVAASWEAHLARQERARAERHFDEVRKLANTFMFDVHEAIQNLPGAIPARQILVSNSLKYLDALVAESADDPALRRELATAYEKLADVQGGYRQSNLGDTRGAIAGYRKALDIRGSLLAVQPADLSLRRDLLRNYGKLGEALSGIGDAPGAIASSRRAMQIAEELAATSGADITDRRNLGSVYVSLGWQMAKAGEIERGLMLMNQGTAVFETLVDENPQDARSQHHAAAAYGRMGEILIAARRYEEALRMHTKQQEISHAMSLVDPTNAELRTIEAYALLGIATVLSKQGLPQEALAKQTWAAATLRALFDVDAKDTEARYNAAFALGELSGTLIMLGKLDEAERKARDALTIIAPSVNASEPSLDRARLLQAVASFRLATIEAQQASERTTAHDQRSSKCAEAQRLFEQSSPVLEAAQRQGDWQMDEDPATQIRKHLNSCPLPQAA